MVCSKCGASIVNDSLFCAGCGVPLQAESSATEVEERVLSPLEQRFENLRENSAMLTASGVIMLVFNALAMLSITHYQAEYYTTWLDYLSLLNPALMVVFGILIISKMFIRKIDSKKPQLILLALGLHKLLYFIFRLIESAKSIQPFDLSQFIKIRIFGGDYLGGNISSILSVVLFISLFMLLTIDKKRIEMTTKIIIILLFSTEIVFGLIVPIFEEPIHAVNYLFNTVIWLLDVLWIILMFVSITRRKHKAFAQPTAEALDIGTGADLLDSVAHVDLVLHILLTLFTFGFWPLIWIYRTTKVLNKTPNTTINNPGTTLLLCLFVPFYTLYWIYKQSQKIEILVRMKNPMHESFSNLYLILGIFLFPVTFILMQDKINKVISGEISQRNTVVAPVQPQQPNYHPPVESTSYIEELKSLKELLDSGVITQEEFEERKEHILGAKKS